MSKMSTQWWFCECGGGVYGS